jgi:hypothetical protein
MHVLACSNSNQALKLSHQDRRWFVPKVTQKKLPPEWWDKFNEWLKRDPAPLKWSALKYGS